MEYTQTDDYKGYRYSVDVNASKTEDHMAYKDSMALIAELNAEYVDLNLLNDELQIDWEQDTRDKGDHMNFFGATKVSKFVAKYLQETKLLENHQGDALFESWNEALIKYQTQESP